MTHGKNPKNVDRSETPLCMSIDDHPVAQVWIDGGATLYARSLVSGWTICVDIGGSVFVGRMVDGQFEPWATFAPEIKRSQEESN